MRELTKSTKKMYDEKNKEMWEEWRALQPVLDEFMEKHKFMMCGFTVNRIFTKFSIHPSEVGEGLYYQRLDAYKKVKSLKKIENSAE